MTDTDTWPEGVPFGQLSPAQKIAAARRASAQLERELRAAAPLISAALEEADAEMKRRAQARQAEEATAWDRAETDACERGTPGCSVRHTRDSACQTW
jgi:hypothetical protein